jgi:conjugal transfer pilus assembly protein TraU
MDKRQYKFQRIGQVKPQTEKINGKCCDPLGRSTILAQSGTEPPTKEAMNLTYAIFRKRDCCSGMLLNAVIGK